MTKELAPKRISQGDLVFMFRRRSKGLGIVVEYVNSIEEVLGANAREVFSKYQSFSTKEWHQRDEFRNQICMRATDHDLAFDFFIYNIAFKGKLKTKFAYVKWFKNPSTFAANGLHAESGWIPARWLKSY